MPGGVFLGAISKTKGRGEAAHAAGPERHHLQCGHRHNRQSLRRQNPESTADRAWRDLDRRPRIYRLYPTAQYSSDRWFRRHARKERLLLPAIVLATGNPTCCALRPDCRLPKLLSSAKLFFKIEWHSLCRSGYPEATYLFNQQFYIARRYRSGPVSLPMAGRAILQMYKTGPADQNILWHHGERR